MNKKYELFKEDMINFKGTTLYRIRALREFTTIDGLHVKVGDLGGYIESEENLSHFDNCWVSGNVKIIENAGVFNNAHISGNVTMRGNVTVIDNARVYDNVELFGNVTISRNALVHGKAIICGYVWISGNAEVFNNARVHSDVVIDGNAYIRKDSDVLSIGPIGSRDGITTFFRTKDNKIYVVCGCFMGSIDEFLKEVENTHGDNDHAKSYKAAVELAKLQIKLSDD